VSDVAKLMNKAFASTPGAMKLLIDDRNARWVQRMAGMMAGHHIYFITVGRAILRGRAVFPRFLPHADIAWTCQRGSLEEDCKSRGSRNIDFAETLPFVKPIIGGRNVARCRPFPGLGLWPRSLASAASPAPPSRSPNSCS